MYCDQCGESVQLSATFCTKCGSKIQNIEESNGTDKSAMTIIPYRQTLVGKYKWALVVLLIAVVSGSYWYASRPELEKGIGAFRSHDYDTAFKNFRPLAEQGNPKAQFLLAGLYIEGQGVKSDEKQAFNWATKSATQGYFDAQYLLSLMYVNGMGVSADGYKSAYWLTKAADNGQEEALIRVSKNPMFLLNMGVLAAQNGDYESAFQVIKYFAEKGDAQAQYLLGGLYSEGKGTSKDIQQAITWYTKSSDQGNIDARVSLYKLNSYDQGLVQQNLPESSKPIDTRLTESGLTYFSLTRKIFCDSPGNDAHQCERLIKDILPNGHQDCDMSMASGGGIVWGGKYKTASGIPITLLFRSGRGVFLKFIPTNSLSCDALPNYLAVGVHGTGEDSEMHKGETSFLSLLFKGDTIYYALTNVISWDDKDNQYLYSRTVYKITSNGPQEFYKQNVASKQLKKLDDALPLRSDLTQFN